MRKERAPARLRAESLGRYFSSAMTLSTASRVSARTPGSLFITRETVLMETFAAAATSVMVAAEPEARDEAMGRILRTDDNADGGGRAGRRCGAGGPSAAATIGAMDDDLTLAPTDAVEPAALHAAFTRAFSDYLIGPFALTPAQWPLFLAKQGVSLPLGRAALRGGEVIAFGFVAPRSPDGWRLSAMGAVPEARGSGAAPRLLDDLASRATASGVRRLELEVFAQNERARRLYEGRGFVARHALHGWTRRASAGADVEDPAADEVDLDAAFAWLDETASSIDELPMQVLPATLRAQRDALSAWRHGGAQLVFAAVADASARVVVWSLVDRNPAQRDAQVLVAALEARHPGRLLKVPALQRADVGGEALARAGFVREPLHQLLMRRELA